ncbi:MAG: hypothetical protein ABEN55_20615, partial [Bradymonadaceae bacterium]
MDTNKGGGSASFYHDFSCAIDISGAAKCWGSDADGELGNNNNKNTQSGNAAETAPVQVEGLVTDVAPVAGERRGASGYRLTKRGRERAATLRAERGDEP